MFVWFFVFFFQQKTAYEVRISDWSSDVCSSDLDVAQQDGRDELHRLYRHRRDRALRLAPRDDAAGDIHLAQYPAAEDMPIGVDVGGPGDDAQYRVARAVGGRAFGHGFKSGSSAKGSSIDSSWPLPLDRKTSPISAAPSITDRPTPAARSEEHTSE